MRLSVLVSALLLGLTSASWVFGSDKIYDSWHKTDLETWLDDHNVPYPAASSRKDLQDLIKKNWESVSAPYSDWTAAQLQKYLKDKGIDVQDSAAETQEELRKKVKSHWYETEESGAEAYSSVKDWIFDSWSESQLKAFLDKHGIPNPQPRTKDAMVQTARSNYAKIAANIEGAIAYPGNWLFESWSDSELKAWLDARGIPVPQHTARNKLIAKVRRNARLAYLEAQASASAVKTQVQASGQKAYSAANSAGNKAYASGESAAGWMAESAQSAAQSVGSKAYHGASSAASDAGHTAYSAASSAGDSAYSAATSAAGSTGQWIEEKVWSAWSDSELKNFADKNGISVPQGSKKNEVKAAVRKYMASVRGNQATQVISSHASDASEKATEAVKDGYARVSELAEEYGKDAFEKMTDMWSDSRLKAYLDARGVPVPQTSTRDQLLAAVRLQKHKAASGWTAWTFDTWTTENLQKFLEQQGHKVGKTAAHHRAELIKSAQSAFAEASKAGGNQYASATSYMAAATEAAKSNAFDTWSDSDLKAYLDTYGIKTYQGSTRNELLAKVRYHAQIFTHGAKEPGYYDMLKDKATEIKETLENNYGKLLGYGSKAGERAADAAKEKATQAKHRAYETAQKAYDKGKEEL